MDFASSRGSVFGQREKRKAGPEPQPFSSPQSCLDYSMLGSSRLVPKSWSSTLLLPKSPFPPRAIVADRPKYLKRCTEDLYASQHENRTGETFTLHDGPPYANGSLHIGHALNKILKDIICRYKLGQGYKVNYVPGWDCHGLPIELKAIEQHASLEAGDARNATKAVNVREAARKLAADAVEEQKKAFRQWGIMADWQNAWKTMDKGYEIAQLKIFKDLVKKGIIHRRFKPVYWSPSSRTALAEAELEYNDNHVSTAAFMKYPMLEGPASIMLPEGQKLNAVIWTTTPWTLPANKAIGINSELEYAIIKSAKHGFLLIATSRLDEVGKACNETFDVVGTIKGSGLADATYVDEAFTGESRRFLHADFVSADSGSGLVHLAPGHGQDDYQLCLKHEIEAFAPIDDEGRFTRIASPRNPDLLYGKEVLYRGNKDILNFLTGKGHLLSSDKFRHKYPYDWRSKQPVIIRATEQWFADIEGVKEDALMSLEAVKFVPEGRKERLKSYVRSRNEWCISSQRAWGVPIPAIFNNETGQAVMTEESIDHIIAKIGARGTDAWWTDDPTDPAWLLPSLKDTDRLGKYSRGKDTMDVWIDSGTSWTQIHSTAIPGAQSTADVYIEGSDQHRGWFQSSLLTCIAQQQAGNPSEKPQAPFRTLITHGFTLDEHSRKMSKSVGNVISPDQIMDASLLPPLKRRPKDVQSPATTKSVLHDAMGPDALRLWVASCDYTNDVIISQTVLKAINGTLSKYRVTFKLLLGMLDHYFPHNVQPNHDEFEILDQIAIMQLGQATERVFAFYGQFEFNRAVQEINRYINTDLSSFYIESIKDTIYADSQYNQRRLQAQYVLFQIYLSMLELLSPVTPLLVEEVLDYAPIQLQTVTSTSRMKQFPREFPSQWRHEGLAKELPWLLTANEAVKNAQEQARAAKNMGMSLQSEVFFQLPEAQGNSEALSKFSNYRSALEALLVVSKVAFCEGLLPVAVKSAQWAYHAEFDLTGRRVIAHVYAPQKRKCIRCWKYNAEQSNGK